MDVEGFRGIEPYHMLKPTRKRDPSFVCYSSFSRPTGRLRSFGQVQNARIVLNVVGWWHENEWDTKPVGALSHPAMLMVGNDCNDFGIQVLTRRQIFKSRAAAIFRPRR